VNFVIRKCILSAGRVFFVIRGHSIDVHANAEREHDDETETHRETLDLCFGSRKLCLLMINKLTINWWQK
jgi:hypothetical protein